MRSPRRPASDAAEPDRRGGLRCQEGSVPALSDFVDSTEMVPCCVSNDSINQSTHGHAWSQGLLQPSWQCAPRSRARTRARSNSATSAVLRPCGGGADARGRGPTGERVRRALDPGGPALVHDGQVLQRRGLLNDGLDLARDGHGAARQAACCVRACGGGHGGSWGEVPGRDDRGGGMGVCPTTARHVARPTLCVSGLCHRLPRAGLGATQTTTDPVRDRRVKFPYPRSLGTLVGVTSGASGPHARTHTHTHTMSFYGPDRGAWRGSWGGGEGSGA